MPLPSKQDLGNSLDLVDIKEIKESTVLLKDGSFRQIIMVGGVNFSLKSETEQNIITQGYQNFLNGVDFPLQILVHSRKVNIDSYIDSLSKRKEIEESPILQNQIDEYTEFVKGFVQKNAIMEKIFLVVVPFYSSALLPTAKSASNLIPFLGKKKTSTAKQAQMNQEEEEKMFRESLAQLNQRSSQITAGLFGIGLDVTILDDEQLVELFYNFYNPQTIERQDLPAQREK